jgi:hypothetical protein
MNGRKYTKLVREGDFVAEVDIELRDDEEGVSGWGPYLSLSDALKLDDVRTALRTGNVAEAAKRSRVFRLMPVNAA